MPDKWNMYQGMPTQAIRDLEHMRRRFDQEFARPLMRAVWDRVPEEMKGFSPAVDVFEKGDELIVKVEIPGVKQDDIDLSVSEDGLIIKGERKPEAGIKDADYDRNEIMTGNFYRSIPLPATVDTKNIEAVYEEGILRVTLHRMVGAKPKKVTIQVKKGGA
jgi:HSP20 family protein